MDFKQLEKLKNEVEKDLNRTPRKYSAQYVDLIRQAYITMDAMEADKSLRTTKRDKERSERITDFKKDFYETMDKYMEVYNRGQDRLSTYGSYKKLQPGDERLGQLDNLLQNDMSRLNQKLTFLIPYSDDFREAWNMQKERMQHVSNVLGNAAKQNYDALMRAANEKKVAETAAEIRQKEADHFKKGFTDEQRHYLLTSGAENPDGKVNKASYNNLSGLISVANVVETDPKVEPESKLRLMTAVSKMQDFYRDNLIMEEDRYRLKDRTKAQDFIRETGAAFTEVETFMSRQQQTPEEQRAFDSLKKGFHQVMDNVLDDVNRTVDAVRYNTWAEWKAMADQEQKKLDVFHQLGKNELMKKHGLTTDEQFFFQVTLENNKDFQKSPINDDVKEILGIEEDKLPEELRAQARNLKSLAYDSAATTMSHYVTDKDGKPRYMSRGELLSLSEKYGGLNEQIKSFSAALKTAGIRQPDPERLDDMTHKLVNGFYSAYEAARYIENNANASERDTVRPFSMYEVLGQVNPDMGDKLPRMAEDVKAQMEDVLAAVDRKKSRTKKQDRQRLQDVAASMDDLTGKILPDFLKADETGNVFAPLTQEKVRKYSDIFAQKEKELAGYLEQMKTQKENGTLTPEEEGFMDMLSGIHKSVKQKSRILGYLDQADGKVNIHGRSLMDDIEQFNMDEALRRENEARTGVAEQSLYSKEEAETLMYAMKCKELMSKNMMYAPFLFEDPAQQRGTALLNLHLTEQNISDVQKRFKQIEKVPWNNDGSRDLSEVEEFKNRSQQLGDRGRVMQYATKNDWDTFEKTVNATLRDMPEKMKHIEILAIRGYKDPAKEAVNLEKLIRDKVQKARSEGCSVLEFMDDRGGLKTILSDTPEFYQYVRPQDEKRVDNFLRYMEQNLANAGLDYYTQSRLRDPHIPDGYNEGVAREQVNTLFGEEDQTPQMNTLKDQKIPLANSSARPDQYMDVKLSSVRSNADETAIRGQEFYTTTDDFRLSDFVGFTMPSEKKKDRIDPNLAGLGEQELKQRLEEQKQEEEQLRREKDKDGKKIRDDMMNSMRGPLLGIGAPTEKGGGKNKQDKPKDKKWGYFGDQQVPYESAMKSGKNLAAMADLQVMDYLTNVGIRKTNDLRLGFKEENGKIRLSGLAAANTPSTRPFLKRSPEEEKKLAQPEDMLVMTAEMYEKLQRWQSGLNGGEGLREDEKKLFDAMDAETKKGFKSRLDHLLKTTDDPKKTSYEDYKHNNLDASKFGLDTKQGRIRVLDRERFDQLKLEDLTVGKNAAHPKDKSRTDISRNIFDTVADLPQMCSDALADKFAARFSGPSSTKFLKKLSSMGMSTYKETKRELDKELNRAKTQDLCYRSSMMLCGNLAEMADKSREKENAWHKLWGDSKLFEDVINAADEMRKITGRNIRLAAAEEQFQRKGKAGFTDAEIAEIQQFRKERLEYSQKLAKQQGQPVPKELPEFKDDQNIYFMSVGAMEKCRTAMSDYLVKRKDPSSDMGQMRYKAIMEQYNELNRSIAEYATLTGDTLLAPSVVKGESGKKPYSPVFSHMYGSNREYELTTPYYHETAEKKNVRAEKSREYVDKMNARIRKKNGSAEEKKEEQPANGFEVISDEEYNAMKQNLSKAKNMGSKKTDAEKEIQKDAPKKEAPKRSNEVKKDMEMDATENRKSKTK